MFANGVDRVPPEVRTGSSMPRATKIGLMLLLSAFPLFAQSNSGELRLRVTDPDGLAVQSFVELVSEANQFRKSMVTDEAGGLVAQHLPFGVYRLGVRHQGFASFSTSLEVHSAVPMQFHAMLRVEPLSTSVTVNDAADPLIDPHLAGTVNRIGTDLIEHRTASLPGRSLQDLVNSQPGWLYEGTAVLHPRGSEYQTQLVVDGIPLTDNRSPSHAPEIEADDVQSMSVYTAGFPAEYGRKMGGIVEVNTTRDQRHGLHGQFVLSGGSFDTGGAFGVMQYGWGKNALALNANGDITDRYLNPPVIQNYTNTATTGGFAASYERELTDHDRLSFSLRHGFSRFLVPNEQIQQAAGQIQSLDNVETIGTVSYQHIFSANVLGDIHGMVRDDSQGLSSNPRSTPVIAFQNDGFREGYFKASVSMHHGNQEWRAGVESDAIFLREEFSDIITDFSQFGPGTAGTFSFSGNRPDLEQSAFVQDLIRIGQWNISAGLRYDHYQLVVNQGALSPRLGVSRYVRSADLVLHASFDRVFQTPNFENILLSSSPSVVSLSPEVLRFPVEPSHGNYYEVGFTKGLVKTVRLDGNYFDRGVNNFADDDLLLETTVSFPIAFLKARIYGAEGKLEIPHWRNLSGFVAYSYMVGSAYLPVTGGLFLGDDARQFLSRTNGRFWVTQDQRNTVRTRFRYQFVPRVWAAFGGEYGSGLPVEFTGTEQQAIAQFGPAIVDRVNFARGRVRPSLALDASVGVDVWKRDTLSIRLQADVLNINNRLNVINFAGLFSGSTVGPPRSYAIRLQTSF
jgi:outer membrane cobalamin receptor